MKTVVMKKLVITPEFIVKRNELFGEIDLTFDDVKDQANGYMKTLKRRVNVSDVKAEYNEKDLTVVITYNESEWTSNNK